jgi:hypothetical protein
VALRTAQLLPHQHDIRLIGTSVGTGSLGRSGQHIAPPPVIASVDCVGWTKAGIIILDDVTGSLYCA